MSIRLLEYKIQDGKDMFLVDYPGKGQRWVFSFMIGGQYQEEKTALKFRYDQQLGGTVSLNGDDSTLIMPNQSPDDKEVQSSIRNVSAVVRSEPREVLKCICQQQHAATGEELTTCSLCHKTSHVRCVRAEGLSALEMKEWQCPFCRILHMDPFNPGIELLMFTTTPRNMLTPSSQDGALTMRFNVQPNVLKDWQVKKISMSVRCIGLGPKTLNVPKGPLWPKDVTASVNSYKDVFKILPGKYGHVRREVPSKEISDLVKPNSNTINIVYKTEVAGVNALVQPPRFMFGVVASEPKSKADILSMIRRPGVAECKERDLGIVHAAHLVFQSLQTQELVIETSADFDIVHSRCPLSLCEMDTPVRGVECEHIQCYDADAYVDVNIRTRNVEKRWRCPVCSKIVRPEDLIVDEFQMNGIRQVKAADIGLDEDGAFVKRLKLNTVAGEWEVLPDEAMDGEGSEDEEELESTKRRKREVGDPTVTEEIILD